MRVAWLDMVSGVAGDMLLGACLDAGVSPDELSAAVERLGLDGVRIDVERTRRHGIAATRCVVEVPDTAGERSVAEIVGVVEAADLPERVVDGSRRVFRRLAAAEGAVHGVDPAEVRLHEAGALDAIVDVVGTVWCLERLGIERLHASRFVLGRGWTETAHGRMPVPPPAVLELVAGWPTSTGDVEAELTTPTGAALVTTLADPGGPPADFVPASTGYGAGSRDLAEQPNLVRLVLGTVGGKEAGELAVVECDLDDLPPELFEPLAEALVAAGARDVAWIPVQMKKRRPGVTVRAIAPRPVVPALGEVLYRESTTLGYRWWPATRETLLRVEGEAETSWGRVAVKRIRRPDGSWEVRPEYEACRAIARKRGRPVREVVAAIAAELAATGGNDSDASEPEATGRVLDDALPGPHRRTITE